MANWIGYIMCRNCFLKHVTEGKMEGRIKVTGRRERRHNQLLHDLEETGGFWKQKEEALDRTLWRTPLGRGRGLVANNWDVLVSQEISSFTVIRLNFTNALYVSLVPVT